MFDLSNEIQLCFENERLGEQWIKPLGWDREGLNGLEDLNMVRNGHKRSYGLFMLPRIRLSLGSNGHWRVHTPVKYPLGRTFNMRDEFILENINWPFTKLKKALRSVLTQCSSISPKAELAKNLTPSLFFSFSNDSFDEFFFKEATN